MKKREQIQLEWHAEGNQAGHSFPLDPSTTEHGFTPNLFGAGPDNPTITLTRRGTIEIKQRIFSPALMPQSRDVQISEKQMDRETGDGAIEPVTIKLDGPRIYAEVRIHRVVDQTSILLKPQTGMNRPPYILLTFHRVKQGS